MFTYPHSRYVPCLFPIRKMPLADRLVTLSDFSALSLRTLSRKQVGVVPGTAKQNDFLSCTPQGLSVFRWSGGAASRRKRRHSLIYRVYRCDDQREAEVEKLSLRGLAPRHSA